MIPEDADKSEAELVSGAIDALRESPPADAPAWWTRAVTHFANPKNLKRREVDRHPLGGVVVTGTGRLHQFDPTYLDDSEPAESFKGKRTNGKPVTLADHSRGVASYAERFAAGCRLDTTLYTQAGLWHDLGKLDPRFQAMLKQSSPPTAVSVPLAKSARPPTREEAEQAREVHGYPKGARHELLSTARGGGRPTTTSRSPDRNAPRLGAVRGRGRRRTKAIRRD